MCGICGFSGSGEMSDLKRMTDSLYHRGPDDHGMSCEKKMGVYLGHRRLSIVDIVGGAQPMWSKDRSLCVVYNGEIYNCEALRQELVGCGHIFKTDHSDTEVLLHGYQQWGRALPDHLNGMWAFAILDKGSHRIFLSRDRFGQKPLFYTLQNGTFAFSSELSSLVSHSVVDSNIAEKSIKKLFAYGFIPSPCSLYRKIYKLPGGYNLLYNIDTASFVTEKYWEFVLEPFDRIPENPEKEWGEHIRALLEQSVRRRFMSDVPLGILLSGGIDSSAITAVAASILGETKIKTFSIGFREDSFDESRFAKRAAGLFDTDHHLEYLSMEKAKDLVPNVLARLDEPMGDSSLLPTYLLCRETRRYVTVALGGDGGDELFAGYDPFHALRLAEIYQKVVPKPIHRGILALASRMPVSHGNMSFDFKIKRTLRGLTYPEFLWNPVWLGPLEPSELTEFFREPVDIEDVYSEAIECWENCNQDNLVDRTLQFYTRLYLQDDILVKSDRASMMNSLELRAPFLDIDLVNFIRRIPHQWKFRKGQTKYILKKALEPLLPSAILHRAKKGFGVPVGQWFRDGSIEPAPGYLPAGCNKDYVVKKIHQHLHTESDHRLFLWNCLVMSNSCAEAN
jgi:asparagine synthase (glutamine-hydrolysing)